MRLSGKRLSASGGFEASKAPTFGRPGHSGFGNAPNEKFPERCNMTDKIALITGASRGLGRSMALHLAERGIGIIGTFRTGAAEADALKQEIQAKGGKAEMIALDVTKSASFAAFCEQVARTLHDGFGRERVDPLPNNPAVAYPSNFPQPPQTHFTAL